MKRLADLHPRWSAEYIDRHLTQDNGGVPSGRYQLSFDCPACGPPMRITITVGPKQDAEHLYWEATPLPDGVDWPSRVTISPSINYVPAGHGRKRPPCAFHGSIINGEIFPS